MPNFFRTFAPLFAPILLSFGFPLTTRAQEQTAPTAAIASAGTIVNEHDLTVSGEAVAVIPVGGMQLTITLSQTSQGAAEATKKLDEREKKVRDILAQSGIKAPLTMRSQRITSSTNPPNVLKPGIAVNVQRDLLVRVNDNSTVGLLVDRLLTVPETAISEQLPVPSSGAEELEAAIAVAVEEATAKAQSVAKQLSVPLGRVLSITVTEEPDGAAIREQMQEGTPPGRYSDRLVKVFVVTRFQLP